MRQKILWTISLVLFNGYLFFWCYFINPADLSTGMGWAMLLSSLFALAVTVCVSGSLLALLIAVFPWRQRKFGQKFKAAFPLSLSIVLTVLLLAFSVTAYQERGRNKKLLSVPKYEEINPPLGIDCSTVRNGGFETGNVFICRKGATQFEIDKDGDGTKQFKVRWLSEYEYELIPVDQRNQTIKVKIVSVTEDGYICYTVRAGFVIRHELKFIKDGKEIKTEACLPYFEFDKLEHYHLEITDKEAQNPALTEKYSSEDKKKVNYLTYTGAVNIVGLDTTELPSLEKWGYVKTELSAAAFEEINSIFCERKHELSQYAACVPVYRDVLVFKQIGRTVGVARICFGCGMKFITGTNRNTEEFGQSGDYNKLEKILDIGQ